MEIGNENESNNKEKNWKTSPTPDEGSLESKRDNVGILLH